MPDEDLHLTRSTKLAWRTNGRRVSRAQGLLANCDDDHAKYLSQKVRVSASAGYSRRENPFSPLCFRTGHETFDLIRLLATRAFVIGTLLDVITHFQSLAHALPSGKSRSLHSSAPVPSRVAAPRQLIRRLSRRPLLLGVSSTSGYTAWSLAPVPIGWAIPSPLRIG